MGAGPGHAVERWLSQITGILRQIHGIDETIVLDRVIDVLREGVQAVPANHPRRADCLYTLGYALQVRFHRVGAPGDLDTAIAALQQSVGATPVGRPREPAVPPWRRAADTVRAEREP